MVERAARGSCVRKASGPLTAEKGRDFQQTGQRAGLLDCSSPSLCHYQNTKRLIRELTSRSRLIQHGWFLKPKKQWRKTHTHKMSVLTETPLLKGGKKKRTSDNKTSIITRAPLIKLPLPRLSAKHEHREEEKKGKKSGSIISVTPSFSTK